LPQAKLKPTYLVVIVFALVFPFVATAQQTPTFGPVLEFSSIRQPRGFLLGDFNGDGLPDIATYNDVQLKEALQSPDSLSFQMRQAVVGKSIVFATGALINGDRLTDLVVITQNPPELQVFLAKANGTFFQRWSAPIHSTNEKLIVADINGDGKNDLILYNKKEPGLTVYLGLGNGSFQQPQKLFDDVVFSNVAILDINGDHINDVVGVNWVTNEVLLYTAYAKMKFGNPAHLPLQQEPSMMIPAYLDSTGTMDLVFCYANDQRLETYVGDGLGGFHLGQSLQLPAKPYKILAADVNDDGHTDLCILNREDPGLDIWLNDGTGAFSTPLNFYPGKHPKDMAIYRQGNSNAFNIALLDSFSTTVRMLYNDRASLFHTTPTSYSLGAGPAGMFSTDLNHDGWVDFLVANTDLKSFSLFLNRKNGILHGQVVFPVLMEPTNLFCAQKDDTTSAILLTGKHEEKIVISELNTRWFTQSSYSIPTLENPQVLSIMRSGADRTFQIYAVETEKSTQQRMLTEFEQVAPSRFIEKDYTPDQPFIGATILRFPDGSSLLVYMKYNNKDRQLEFYRSPLEERRKNPPSRLLFRLSAPVQPNAYVWNADLNGDGIPDLIINILEPDNKLYVSMGQRDTSYSQPRIHLSDGISVGNPENLKVADVNSDGIPDIVLNNDLNRTFEVYLGTGNGAFLHRVRIMSSEGIGGFALTDMNHDGKPELVVSDAASGLLRVIELVNEPEDKGE
jgi:hypothetical protein